MVFVRGGRGGREGEEMLPELEDKGGVEYGEGVDSESWGGEEEPGAGPVLLNVTFLRATGGRPTTGGVERGGGGAKEGGGGGAKTGGVEIGGGGGMDVGRGKALGGGGGGKKLGGGGGREAGGVTGDNGGEIDSEDEERPEDSPG